MFFEYRLKEGEALRYALPCRFPPRCHESHCTPMANPEHFTTPRLEGNERFKEGKFSEAAVKYRKGLYYSVFDESQFNFELQDDHR